MAMRKREQAQMRNLVRHMQAVLYARRVVRRCFPPLTAAVLDVWLRLVGAWIVDEMRRVEGSRAA